MAPLSHTLEKANGFPKCIEWLTHRADYLVWVKYSGIAISVVSEAIGRVQEASMTSEKGDIVLDAKFMVTAGA